jgi:hypothetical protein
VLDLVDPVWTGGRLGDMLGMQGEMYPSERNLSTPVADRECRFPELASKVVPSGTALSFAFAMYGRSQLGVIKRPEKPCPPSRQFSSEAGMKRR